MQIGQLIIASTVGFGVFSAAGAIAQSFGTIACGDREALVQRLERAFGEVQAGAGLVNGAQLFEVWRSDETGTWTILMTNANGTSCVVAAGDAWRDVDENLVAKGDPT